MCVFFSLSCVSLTLLLRPLCWDSDWFCGFIGLLSSGEVKQNSDGKVRTRTTHLVVDTGGAIHSRSRRHPDYHRCTLYVSLFLHVRIIGCFLILGTPFREDLIFHMLWCSIQLRDEMLFAFPNIYTVCGRKWLSTVIPKDHSRNQHTEKCSVPYTSLIHLSSAIIAEVQLMPTTMFPQDLSQTRSHAYLPILPTRSWYVITQ